MLKDALAFYGAIEGKVKETIRAMSGKNLQCERYDVTTAPNSVTGKIGVTQPYGKEIFVPYSAACADAQIGDPVLVVWWKSLSNAKAWFPGGGLSNIVTSVAGKTGAVALVPADVGLGTSAEINAISHQLGTAIPSGADLNSYTTPGSYYCADYATAATLSNAPIVNNFRLEVTTGGNINYPLQFCWSSSTVNIFVRRYTGTWGAWIRLLNTVTDIFTHGSSWTGNSSLSLNGFVTNGSTRIIFDIPLPRNMDVANVTPTVTAVSGQLRGLTGYIDSTSSINFVTGAAYTPSVAIAADNRIRLQIDKSSVFINAADSSTVTNNTVMSFFGTVTLTF